ncbi:MAG: hypothetical protein Q7R81_04475 [Candidatus Peregrinibacteria bacterium]|nr:hypothetical protein [Candidatus Peregrinibacteria bacterium]
MQTLPTLGSVAQGVGEGSDQLLVELEAELTLEVLESEELTELLTEELKELTLEERELAELLIPLLTLLELTLDEEELEELELEEEELRLLLTEELTLLCEELTLEELLELTLEDSLEELFEELLALAPQRPPRMSMWSVL